uniref:Uncharacterized protein n=1 Tax=viral metagenome TaxID=1070528 RepID=A0A6M3JGV0_9ZZZZ
MKLPKDRYERTIKEMPPHTSGWTVPWAMYADEDGELWINGNYTVFSDRGGTVNMLVGRTSSGVVVSIVECDAKWSRGKPYFAGDFTPLRVEDLIK